MWNMHQHFLKHHVYIIHIQGVSKHVIDMEIKYISCSRNTKNRRYLYLKEMLIFELIY